MKKLHLFFLLFTAFVGQASQAQSKLVIEAYIDKYKAIAMAEMARTGVPASITLAQGIHETGAGTSQLVRESNNHFGIKCKTEWTGEKVYHDDDARGECFRKYDDPSLSYKDHSDFLRNRTHYSALFSLDPEDFEAWAYGLKKAGYATNPKYPQILIKLIRDYNLQDYTLVVLGKKELGQDEPTWANVSVEPVKGAMETEEIASPKTVYPQGVFIINKTKVIAVSRGTSYLKMAEENGISLARLFEFNDMDNGDVAKEDGLLYLQRKRKTGAQDMHVVAPGETLYRIAQAEGIRLESLLEYNHLSATANVQAGEKLYLQQQAPTRPKLFAGKPLLKTVFNSSTGFGKEEKVSSSFLVHVVQPKDTVYSIARRYEVAVDEVKMWNEMESTDLKVGQQIKINKSR